MATKRKKSKVASKKVTRSGKIWVMGVDPFADDLRHLWDMVKPLAERSNAKMVAAYVLSPSSLNWTGDFSGPWIGKYKPLAETKLGEILPEKDIRKEVVPCRGTGLRASAEALMRFARREKADCLVISSHSRSGFERLAMGSFAETLILMSKIPTLVLKPTQKVPKSVHKILIPTDLSKKSEKFIEAAAAYAKALDAEIVLFHKQPDPLDPLIQQGFIPSAAGG